MDVKEIVKWLKCDLNENIEIREGLVNEAATEKVDKIIQALSEAIGKLQEVIVWVENRQS